MERVKACCLLNVYTYTCLALASNQILSPLCTCKSEVTEEKKMNENWLSRGEGGVNTKKEKINIYGEERDGYGNISICI